MAFTKTHILCTFLATKYAGVQFQPEIFAYSILPDSICFLNFGDSDSKHALSHFEVNPDTGVASSMMFPTTDELKLITSEDIRKKICHFEGSYERPAFGNVSNIGAFVQTNTHLPDIEFRSVLSHLVQDAIDHDYLKRMIEITGEERNMYKFNVTGGVYAAESVRKLKTRIGQQIFRYLSKIFSEETNCNLYEFFKTAVFPAIEDTFCRKMAKGAINFINLTDDGAEPISKETCEIIVNDMLQATTKIWK